MSVQEAPSPTPYVDLTGEHPTVVSQFRVRGRCYGSSSTGGECEAMELSFESTDEWNEHRSKHHPVGCSESGCDILAAYSRDNNPWSCCFKHIPDDPDCVYKWKRTNTESIVQPPKAEGHIIEEVLPPAENTHESDGGDR